MNPTNKVLAAGIMLMQLQSVSAFATIWYVAANGVDTNPGTSNSPFATIMRAQSAASSGDTVYLRGGTYHLDSSHLTVTNSPWAVVNYITKNGVSYLGYPGELPVFDFSAVAPYGYRTTAFQISASNCVFKNFDVVGLPVVILDAGTQSECFRVSGGSNNLLEQLRMHDGHGIGFYLTEGASNLVLNCDAYNNSGANSFSHGNIDGFGVHAGHTYSTGNIIRGCRAWNNSDDAYDLINCFAPVVMENCLAMDSGFFTNGAATGGNANGFKAGGFDVGSKAKVPPNPPPRHVTRYCLAVGNGFAGFYANFHPDGLDFIGNTAIDNKWDYHMRCNTNNVSRTNDTPGINHFMRNNLGMLYSGTNRVTWLDINRSDVVFNYFSLPVNVTSNDFMSLDRSLLTAPRQADGSLPYTAYAQLVSDSDLKDAGTNVGFAFVGAAPDLGAFEYGINPPPTLAMTSDGANLIFTGGGGPGGGMNYLVTTTNVAEPMAQWSRVATNQFDLAGGYAFTNSIPTDVSQQFYRIGLP